METPRIGHPVRRLIFASFCLVACGFGTPPPLSAQSPERPAASQPLARDAAVQWALINNPELAAIRQQRGIAAARVVTADTYPFNPVWEGKVRGVGGPASAGITNRVDNEHAVVLETELHGQRGIRREGASAGVSRAESEIAQAESRIALRVIRAFDAVLYRTEKFRLIEANVRLNEQAADQAARLAEQAKLRPADVILARTEVEDVRTQLTTARASLTSARQELRRALGVVSERFDPDGSLAVPDTTWDEALLTQTALERRPDLRARQAAVAEAEARLKLAIADRHGNPTVGINYQYDDARANLTGVQFSIPLPVLNRRRGEILEREGERDRAVMELRQSEIEIRQDVAAALARMDDARRAVAVYQDRVLPSLEANVASIDRLLEQADPGVDLLRVIDVRRKLLRARDGYADAVAELRQALADLAAAVGNPAIALSDAASPDEPPRADNQPPP